MSVPPPPRRPGLPLGERRLVSTSALEPQAVLPTPRVRHVWVQAPSAQTGAGAMWVAGVLLRWERPAEGLRGLVAYVVADDSGSPVLVTQALAAGLIRPADPGPPPG
ncbi:MAG TPA: hypothetical protein PKI09_03855 [Dermatophilaceae bacterium]|nr:hypothetical protein [Dermatophilaceae bacterium]HPZ67474.1 hypothetical protein [Dermatophilaceae bacterium]